MSKSAGSGTVLVVDDDKDILDIMRMVLEGSGYRMMEARDGTEALALLRVHRPCVIFLDLMMPGMDGFRFRELQQQDPTLASIPVVVISGAGDLVAKSAAVGAAGYLVKPPELERVLQTVARHCRSATE